MPILILCRKMKVNSKTINKIELLLLHCYMLKKLCLNIDPAMFKHRTILCLNIGNCYV